MHFGDSSFNFGLMMGTDKVEDGRVMKSICLFPVPVSVEAWYIMVNWSDGIDVCIDNMTNISYDYQTDLDALLSRGSSNYLRVAGPIKEVSALLEEECLGVHITSVFL